MKKAKAFLLLSVFVLMSMATISCNDNSEEGPTNRFRVTLSNTGEVYELVKSGAFTTPVGASSAAAIGPGERYEFSFTAPPGARLSLSTMFVQSNDWIYATGENGIPLYNEDGSKHTGNVTDMIDLYDVGTEMDQEPGTGSNQAPRQSGTDTGPADDNPNVRRVQSDQLPADDEVIRVEIMSSSSSNYGFTVRIENVSDNMTLQTSEGSKAVPLSPGIYAVHHASQTAVLFEEGQPDYGEGLEDIAEDGMPGMLAENLGMKTGITPLYSPGVYAIYEGENPVFMEGESAMGNGLEALAEDGAASSLMTSLQENDAVTMTGIFNMPTGNDGAGPLTPGQSYEFEFEAEEGDKLTFATMFVQSNDWFYAPAQSGIPLFTNGAPNTGEVTGQVHLWDAGTEINEEPGIGAYQAPRQGQTDSGPEDSNREVRMVGEQTSLMKHLNVEIERIR